MSKNTSSVKIIYVLLDGVGDLPNKLLNDLTPLEAAYTPNMDSLARNGCMGRVITVGKNIAPQSDIAVFNMLGYSFKDGSYVGRGVIECIGCNIDFREGDLALRGNFATVDDRLQIIDRRAGRNITVEESQSICKTLRENILFTDKEASIIIEPTVGHRTVIRFRHNQKKLSDKVTNTDPAYDKINGMGIAKKTTSKASVLKSMPVENTESAKLSAKLINEFTENAIRILKTHPININRAKSGKKIINAIIVRDSGNKYPNVVAIDKKYCIKISCIVDMPVEIGISKVLRMKAFKAGNINDYEIKAEIAAKSLQEFDAIYVHIKGPDEFGHDGDARGKKKNIEDIDKRFFGTLINKLKTNNYTIIISADHCTPCIMKSHSDDPVPILISGNMINKDGTSRFTEKYGEEGSIGLINGENILTFTLNMILNKNK
jgi:2,3-bisphosphoglycerate-independent phosphoglycerate mutase